MTHCSIFVTTGLSLAAGIPFLGGSTSTILPRTLLLDRELSKWSLFKRLHQLMDDRPGYKAAMENLLIDHDHLLRLDQPNAYDTLLQLVEQNGAEVVIMDTAYKFLGGDIESSSALIKAFEVLDRVLHETGCSFVITHHMRKGSGRQGQGEHRHPRPGLGGRLVPVDRLAERHHPWLAGLWLVTQPPPPGRRAQSKWSEGFGVPR